MICWRHRLKRLAVALLSVLQLGVPPVVGLADATLAARAFAKPSRVHVEDFGTRDAVASHPDNCALCQVLRLSSAPPSSPPPVLLERAHAASWPADRRAVRTVAHLGLPDTRAPPSAQ